MDIKKLKELVKVLEESTLSEIEIESDSLGKVKLKKEQYTNISVNEVSKGAKVVQTITETTSTPSTTQVVGTTINSPLVGTYYESPSPDKSAFVKVGDRVSKGQVVCIIEAMKVMNEIVSPVDGIVRDIKVANSSLVQYDQVLMVIE